MVDLFVFLSTVEQQLYFVDVFTLQIVYQYV